MSDKQIAMNADRVEHRGMVAFQGTCGGMVHLCKGGRRVAKIPVDRRQTVEEMKGIIDEYLKGSERG